jgi:hypothetical protein
MKPQLVKPEIKKICIFIDHIPLCFQATMKSNNFCFRPTQQSLCYFIFIAITRVGQLYKFHDKAQSITYNIFVTLDPILPNIFFMFVVPYILVTHMFNSSSTRCTQYSLFS